MKKTLADNCNTENKDSNERNRKNITEKKNDAMNKDAKKVKKTLRKKILITKTVKRTRAFRRKTRKVKGRLEERQGK